MVQSNLFLFMALLLLQQATTELVVPSVVGVTVDGNTNDWDLSSLRTFPMYEAGNADKEHAADAYIQTKCAPDQQSTTLCILVQARGTRTIDETLDNAWYKDYQLSQSTADGTIEWVRNAQEQVVGWEGCFLSTTANLRSEIEIHANYGGGRTASTGKKHKSPQQLDLSCAFDVEKDQEETKVIIIEEQPMEEAESSVEEENEQVSEQSVDQESQEDEEDTSAENENVNDGEEAVYDSDYEYDYEYDYDYDSYEDEENYESDYDVDYDYDSYENEEEYDSSEYNVDYDDAEDDDTDTNEEAQEVFETTGPDPCTSGNIFDQLHDGDCNEKQDGIPASDPIPQVACVLGDPHLYTFDGLQFDCQGSGDYILHKSENTDRIIQAQFAHFEEVFSEGSAWSVTKGLAIQEADAPLIQISIPTQEQMEDANNQVSNCPILFFMDGFGVDLLMDGTLSMYDSVEVSVADQKITIKYLQTGLAVTVTFGDANGCYLDICVYLPDVDSTSTGLLGSADGNVWNDFTSPDGDSNVLPVPENLMERMGKAGYDYCTTKWCIRDEWESLFTYPQGEEVYVNHCDLPYGDTLQEYWSKNASPESLAYCGKSDYACIIDYELLGIDAAWATLQSRLALEMSCNGLGGECNVADCCDGLSCIEVGAEMRCEEEGPLCQLEWGSCNSDLSCCDELECVEQTDGRELCMKLPECISEWDYHCNFSECCQDGEKPLECVETETFNGATQFQCRAACVDQWAVCEDDSSCCDENLYCLETSQGIKQCMLPPVEEEEPSCVAEEWAECYDTDCCEGMKCHTGWDGRSICRNIPNECAPEWQDCSLADCCNDDESKPLVCEETVGWTGYSTYQCKMACAAPWAYCSEDKPCCPGSGKTCQATWGDKFQCV